MRRIGLSRVTKEIGKLSVSVAIVAAIVADGKFIDAQTLEQAVIRFQSPTVAQANLKAVQMGLGLAG